MTEKSAEKGMIAQIHWILCLLTDGLSGPGQNVTNSVYIIYE